MVRNSTIWARQWLKCRKTQSIDTAHLPAPMIHLKHKCVLGCYGYDNNFTFDWDLKLMWGMVGLIF